MSTHRLETESSPCNTYGNTRSALSDLENLLKCTICKMSAASPVTLGGCEHIFCSTCCENYLGGCCPVCDLPAHVKDAEVDRQLFNMVTLCGRLRDIFDEEKNTDNNIQESTVESVLCTPNHGISRQKAFKDVEQEFTKVIEKSSQFEEMKIIDNKENGNTVTHKIDSKAKTRKKSTPGRPTDSNDKQAVQKQEKSPEWVKVKSAGHKKPKSARNLDNSNSSVDRQECLINRNGKSVRRSRLNESVAEIASKDIDAELTTKGKSITAVSDILSHGQDEVTISKLQTETDKCIKVTKTNCTNGIANTKTKSRRLNTASKSGKKAGEDKSVSGKVNGTHEDIKPQVLHSKKSRKSKATKLQDDSGNLQACTNKAESRKKVNKGKNINVNESILSGESGSKMTNITETGTPTTKRSKLEVSDLTLKMRDRSQTISSPGLNKRNAKGETLLQVASIKNDISRVRHLLEGGANPNVRDNAGWTPLHEACNHGYTEVARLLLDHGAMMNVPGFENDCPLHDAVSNNRLDCVRLLVSRGASTTARNLHGLTPMDYAHSKELKEALHTKVMDQVSTETEVIDVLEYQMPCIVGTGLSREGKTLLQKTLSHLKVKLAEEVTPEVTHIVTKCNADGMCPRTVKIVQGILSGKWILNMEWLSLCKELNSLVCEEAFEVEGLSMFPHCKSPYKGRLNRKQQLPSLFDGCWFYFNGEFEYSIPSKEDLIETIKIGGGRFLTREPKPGHLDKSTLTVPYHADPESDLKDCCTFIVSETGSKFQPIRTKYVCSVPASWIIDCAATFTLLPLP